MADLGLTKRQIIDRLMLDLGDGEPTDFITVAEQKILEHYQAMPEDALLGLLNEAEKRNARVNEPAQNPDPYSLVVFRKPGGELTAEVRPGNVLRDEFTRVKDGLTYDGAVLKREQMLADFSVKGKFWQMYEYGERALPNVEPVKENAAKSTQISPKKPPINETWEEQKQTARNADLLSYFQRKNYEIEKKGSEYYIKNYPGLCVNPAKGMWHSHYENVGGKNSVDCLTKILGIDFKTAVEELSGASSSKTSNFSFQPAQKNESPSAKTAKDFVLPEAAENYSRVVAYLTKTRKIPYEIVQEFIKSGKLYQEKNTGNAVFPHKKDGEFIGAEIQGTLSNVRFKGVAAGTKNSAFSVGFSPEVKKVYVFESAIDLMSFYAMIDREKNNLDGIGLVSMAGLKPNAVKELQERGIEIISCVDNDEKGRKFESDNGFKRYGDMLEKEGVKDWNELLLKLSEGEKIIGVSEKTAADINVSEDEIDYADIAG